MKQGEAHLQLVQELKKTMVGDVQRLQDEVQPSYQILQPRENCDGAWVAARSSDTSLNRRQAVTMLERHQVTAVRGRECSPTAARGAPSSCCPVSCHLHVAVLSTEITTLKGEKTSLQQQILGHPPKTSHSKRRLERWGSRSPD